MTIYIYIYLHTYIYILCIYIYIDGYVQHVFIEPTAAVRAASYFDVAGVVKCALCRSDGWAMGADDTLWGYGITMENHRKMVLVMINIAMENYHL